MFTVPSCGYQPCILQGYVDAAKALRLPGLDEDTVDVRKLVQTHLSQSGSGSWILVFDNADDSAFWLADNRAKPDHPLLFDLLPKNRRGSIIFTSRDATLASRLASPHVLHLSHVGEIVGKQLLNNYLDDRKLLNNESDTTALLQWLGYLPLAIVQAATYINENAMTLGQYLSLLNSQDGDAVQFLSRDFNDFGRYGNGMNPIATTWLVSFAQLRERNPLAVQYLSFISCLDWKNIPLTLRPSTGSAQDDLEAVGALKSYSFVSQDPKTQFITAHRLVHLVMRNWLEKRRTVGVRPKGCPATYISFEQPYRDRINQWRPFLPHAHYLLNSSRDTCPVLDRVYLLQGYGFCLHLHGRDQEAEAPLEEASKLCEALDGPDSIRACDMICTLAITYVYRRKLEMAESLLLEVIKKHESASNGNREQEILNTKLLPSCVYGEQGRLQEAEVLQRQILQSRKTLLGLEHESTVASSADLAATIYRQGRLHEGLDILMGVFEVYRLSLGESDPETLHILDTIAFVHHRMGNLHEAEKLYCKILEERKVSLGIENPDTLRTVHQLSTVLHDQGRRQEALDMLRMCLEGRRQTLGADHPQTILAAEHLNYWQSESKGWRLLWASLRGRLR